MIVTWDLSVLNRVILFFNVKIFIDNQIRLKVSCGDEISYYAGSFRGVNYEKAWRKYCHLESEIYEHGAPVISTWSSIDGWLLKRVFNEFLIKIFKVLRTNLGNGKFQYWESFVFEGGIQSKLGFLGSAKDSGFIADPFFLIDKEIIAYEYYDYKSSKGHINCLANGVTRVLLEENYHLSWPFSFRSNGSVYLLPESSNIGVSYLYKVELGENGPAIIGKREFLELPLVDPVVVSCSNDLIILMSTEKSEDVDLLENDISYLYLIKHKNLTSFEVVEKILLTIDCDASRNGGIFEIDDNRYFIKQKNSFGYGKGIAMYELRGIASVTTAKGLSRRNLKVEMTKVPMKGLSPLPNSVHTLNGSVNVFLYDNRIW